VGLQFQAHSLRYRPLDDGFSMNIIVLFALILVVGMLVGNVDHRIGRPKLQEGIEPKEALFLCGQAHVVAHHRVTATTLSVFFPLLFWSGMVGVHEILTDHSYLTLSSCSWR
jgi:multidrug efflux pump subunit AcrB